MQAVVGARVSLARNKQAMADAPITRKDIKALAPDADERWISRWVLCELVYQVGDVRRSWLLRALCRLAEADSCATSWPLQGIAVPAGYTGSTKQMASRRQWAPDLQWEVPKPEAANTTLVRRYLEAYGPATCRDFAHWRGCRVSDARRWWDAVTDDASCYVVVHEGERGQQMIACKSDLELLATHVRGGRCACYSMVVR